jgi:uncharacterized protein (DUF488 family)
MLLYSVGHSDRSAPAFVELLGEAGVEQVADVRRFPASRRHPQFSRAALERFLAKAGLEYLFLGDELGGRREPVLPVEDSPNRALADPALRGYADAMTGARFLAGVEALETAARTRATVMLCAERDWWRCHRSLLSDLLVARGGRVVHLVTPGRSEPHALSKWARIEDGSVRYPALL